MIAQMPWVERKFNFDMPVGIFPCILERIIGTPARIEEMVTGLSEELLRKKINGKWSIKEQVGHLADLDELHDGRLEDFYEGKETLRAADMNNRKTEEGNHNATPLENLLMEFRDKRMQFVSRLKNIEEQQLSITSIHPRLKTAMRLVDMILFIADHDDHHLAKIRWIMNESSQ